MMFQQSRKHILLALLTLSLGACGGGSDDSNEQPIISAEVPDQVDELNMVNLISLAEDLDGEISQYSWSQSAGPDIQLINASTSAASFVAPEVIDSETIGITLQVQDDEGAIAQESYTIVVNNVNKAPVVTINAPETADEMSAITLVGHAIDIDGDIHSYVWQQTQGPEVESMQYDGPEIHVTLPDIAKDQMVSFELLVTDNESSITTETVDLMVKALSLAQTDAITADNVVITDSNPSIFISSVTIDVNPDLLSSLAFEIAPLQNAKASPITARYDLAKLEKNEIGIVLPIFGLYRGHSNEVSITANYLDGSSSSHIISIDTDSIIYPDNNPYNNYTINQGLTNVDKPSYDYILMKTGLLGPVIIDIDGNVRWQSLINSYPQYSGHSSLFSENSFVLALDDELHHINLDGSTTTHTIEVEGLTDITAHHELSHGKQGYLVQLDANKPNVEGRIIESILVEVDAQGNVLKYWDFAKIFVDYMLKNADDPTNFVRNGIDWFHMNTAIYYAEDNSLIVSSRENFVVKIDYDTSEIKWLLGDESKHWYVNYPSLRPLSLQSNDQKPIGQHALSVVDGQVMLFNNGQLSFNQPDSAPKGEVLTSSKAAKYIIDEARMSASIDWQYDADIYSDVCSSVYQDTSSGLGDYLINYSAVNRLNDDPLSNIVRGINQDQELLFEFIFDLKSPCGASWNSEIIYGLDNLLFE